MSIRLKSATALAAFGMTGLVSQFSGLIQLKSPAGSGPDGGVGALPGQKADGGQDQGDPGSGRSVHVPLPEEKSTLRLLPRDVK
jgi:hypothetical protein